MRLLIKKTYWTNQKVIISFSLNPYKSNFEGPFRIVVCQNNCLTKKISYLPYHNILSLSLARDLQSMKCLVSFVYLLFIIVYNLIGKYRMNFLTFFLWREKKNDFVCMFIPFLLYCLVTSVYLCNVCQWIFVQKIVEEKKKKSQIYVF